MNNIIFKRVIGPQGFQDLIREAGLNSDCYIIKPNWFSFEPGDYTDTRVLEFLLRSLPGRKFVVESYTGWRNDGSRKISADNAKKHWNWLRDQDFRFLSETGLNAIFRDTGTQYINLTEECWRGNVVDYRYIQELVEEKYPPIRHKELYGCVSRSLFRNRDGVFISLARMKTHLEGSKPTVNLSLKNMFGLIPDPVRFKYHGRYGELLDISTIDINKIYHAIYPVVGILEAFPSAIVYHPGGSRNTRWGNYDLIDDCNFLIFGDSLAALDCLGARIMEFDPDNLDIFKETGEQFGNWRTANFPAIPADIHEKFKPLLHWKISAGKKPPVSKPPPVKRTTILKKRPDHRTQNRSRDIPPPLTRNK